MMTDSEIVQAIIAFLDGQEWDADTLDRVADVIERGGYKLRAPSELSDAEYERAAEAASRIADAR